MWTPIEDTWLREYVKQDFPLEECAKLLNKTYATVKLRACKLGLDKTKKLRKSWHIKELKLIKQYTDEKLTLKECAKRLNTTEVAIKLAREKIKKEGIPEKRTKTMLWEVWGITNDQYISMSPEEKSKLCFNCPLADCVNCIGNLSE